MPKEAKRAANGSDRKDGSGAERRVLDLLRVEGQACRRRCVRVCHFVEGRKDTIDSSSEGVRKLGI